MTVLVIGLMQNFVVTNERLVSIESGAIVFSISFFLSKYLDIAYYTIHTQHVILI